MESASYQSLWWHQASSSSSYISFPCKLPDAPTSSIMTNASNVVLGVVSQLNQWCPIAYFPKLSETWYSALDCELLASYLPCYYTISYSTAKCQRYCHLCCLLLEYQDHLFPANFGAFWLTCFILFPTQAHNNSSLTATCGPISMLMYASGHDLVYYASRPQFKGMLYPPSTSNFCNPDVSMMDHTKWINIQPNTGCIIDVIGHHEVVSIDFLKPVFHEAPPTD